MENINKIIDSLSPVEQNLMYNALQKKLNRGPDWSDSNEYKYFIIYKGDIYKVDYNWTSIYDRIYFKNKKDAQAVIDNPNFRDILDVIYKN